MYTTRMQKELIKFMKDNKNLGFSDFSGSDASNVLVAIASLQNNNVKFIQNVVAVVEHHMKSLYNGDLINLGML